jgi:hypothetical protein
MTALPGQHQAEAVVEQFRGIFTGLIVNPALTSIA